ncbi:HDOD domain-containing protein [Geomesophilobacter sediminis]|uniref:HDOD domain-containing protein n=1 Tax=Geomesophilobacter sediminis TaxID=2798584 RepID=A0A8J7M1M3_9BACT|nr:HDOD domain-containing protein [Geomesophilobacter sediminis]MBJ6726992.1 HDOD domain-containing protein [Geomesophilobacter sediminis]
MSTKSFVELIQDQLTQETLNLPMFHPIAVKLQALLSAKDFTIDQVVALIIKDPALTSQILRLANSAFFSGLSKVTTITEAVVRLGAREVASVAMLASQQNSYQSLNSPELKAYAQLLWRHAIGCAIGSRWLAEKTGYGHLAQEAFIAGLLHDIGNLLILKVVEGMGGSEEQPIKSISRELVTEIMLSMHADSGYELMQRWNLPDLYCVIVRDHHREQKDTSNLLLSIVHLVDNACRKIGISNNPDPSLMLAATFEAQGLGIKEIMLAELEIMIEDAMDMVNPAVGDIS